MFSEVKVTIALRKTNILSPEEIAALRARLQEGVEFNVFPGVLHSNSSKYLIFSGEGPAVPYFKMWEKLQTVEIFRALGPCAVTWTWQTEEGAEFGPFDAGFYSPEDCESMLKAGDTIQRLLTKRENQDGI